VVLLITDPFHKPGGLFGMFALGIDRGAAENRVRVRTTRKERRFFILLTPLMCFVQDAGIHHLYISIFINFLPFAVKLVFTWRGHDWLSRDFCDGPDY